MPPYAAVCQRAPAALRTKLPIRVLRMVRRPALAAPPNDPTWTASLRPRERAGVADLALWHRRRRRRLLPGFTRSRRASGGLSWQSPAPGTELVTSSRIGRQGSSVSCVCPFSRRHKENCQWRRSRTSRARPPEQRPRSGPPGTLRSRSIYGSAAPLVRGESIRSLSALLPSTDMRSGSVSEWPAEAATGAGHQATAGSSHSCRATVFPCSTGSRATRRPTSVLSPRWIFSRQEQATTRRLGRQVVPLVESGLPQAGAQQ